MRYQASFFKRHFAMAKAFFLNFLFVVVLFTSSRMAIAELDDQSALQSVQSAIKQQENALQQQKQTQEKINTALKTYAQQSANSEKALQTLKDENVAINKKIKATESEIAKLTKAIKAQKKLLQHQIELVFRQGQSSSMEMLFASDDTQRNDRVVGYINYLNREREKTIVTIKDKEKTLQAQKLLVEKEKQALKKNMDKQQTEIKGIEKAKEAQAKLLSKLKQEMNVTEDNIISLRDDEINLQYKIKQAIRDQERQALAKQKTIEEEQVRNQEEGKTAPKTIAEVKVTPSSKRLSMPIQGKLITQYGEALGGELVSKGLVIGASLGSPVKAVAAGTVLIADHLQGYGKVIVIDHGDGYMSLYGYNNAVKVSAGQTVAVGDVISSVGRIEGDNGTALYFEIRKEGDAINPFSYLSK